ncbi:MAG TPA: serine/threonine-protein kinase [Candidatus Dormibacteraeota bacterium]|nr:serine/threonine-protein kinase [Candidatus Dormibacteraeota bacterium]
METQTSGADLSGRRLGPYRLERLIGSGAFGSVYRARHAHLGVLRAIKVLQTDLARVPQLQARFLQEAKTAAGLSHPCIVPVYDFGVDEGVQYIVMEYVESVTLARFMGAMEPARRSQDPTVLGAIRDIASALDYAHAQGILHRDLKPANVLIRDSDRRAMLTDFGVAKVLRGSGMTETGMALGSYAYMSPEQCSGSTQLTARSDIYAFAAVLYEIVTGAPPFGNGLSAVAGHLSQPVPPVRRLASGLPETVDEVLRRGLAKRPEDRPASTGELAAAFLEAMAEPTVVGLGGGSGPRPQPPPPPRAIPTAPASSARPWREPPPPPTSPVPAVPAPRSRLLVVAALASVLVLAAGVVLAIAEASPVLQPGGPRQAPSPHPVSFPSDFPIPDPQHAVIGTLGQPVEVKGSSHARVTVVAAATDDPGTPEVSLADSASDRFVDVLVQVQNLSREPLSYGAYDWWLSDSTGHAYPEVASPMSPGLPADESQLASEDTAEGYVSFEVPKSASGLEVWATIGDRAVRVPVG